MEGLGVTKTSLAKDIGQQPSNVASVVDSTVVRTGELKAGKPNCFTKTWLFGKMLPLRHKTFDIDVRCANWIRHPVKFAVLPELLEVVVAPRTEHESVIPIEPRLEGGDDILKHWCRIDILLIYRRKPSAEGR